MPDDPNTAAEIFDVFFNGRPAPSREAKPQTVRIKLTREQAGELLQGKSLRFQAGPIIIELLQAKRA